jgi:flavodoxin
MEYAVLYYSESGNTEILAKEIYESIDSAEKQLINLQEEQDVPYADIYFVGFPIHQKNCGIKIVDALEQIEEGKLVFFATCGLTPTDNYRQKLEDALSLWIPEEVEFLGMFLCQGSTTDAQKEIFYQSNPKYRDKLTEMFGEGDSHPNSSDREDAVEYIRQFL